MGDLKRSKVVRCNTISKKRVNKTLQNKLNGKLKTEIWINDRKTYICLTVLGKKTYCETRKKTCTRCLDGCAELHYIKTNCPLPNGEISYKVRGNNWSSDLHAPPQMLSTTFHAVRVKRCTLYKTSKGHLLTYLIHITFLYHLLWKKKGYSLIAGCHIKYAF